MSDFLLVVPDGWVEIPNDPEWIGSVIDVTYLNSLLSEQQWLDIDNLLTSMVALPEGKTVAQARLIQTDTGYRFWVRYN
jgi:hypothetical protein